jgi:hypothetical protein
VLIEPAQTRCTRRAARHPADNDDSHQPSFLFSVTLNTWEEGRLARRPSSPMTYDPAAADTSVADCEIAFWSSS